jgi:hypothetical protein
MDFDLKEIAYVPTTGVRRTHQTPLVIANDESLKGYGCLVEAPTTFPIEIVRLAGPGLAPGRRQFGRSGGRHRRSLRILVARRDALRAQQRGRR